MNVSVASSSRISFERPSGIFSDGTTLRQPIV